MIRYLTLIEVLELHRKVLEQSRGALGIRDIGLLESAIAQPRMTFGGEDLYPSLLEKAAALGFSGSSRIAVVATRYRVQPFPGEGWIQVKLNRS